MSLESRQEGLEGGISAHWSEQGGLQLHSHTRGFGKSTGLQGRTVLNNCSASDLLHLRQLLEVQSRSQVDACIHQMVEGNPKPEGVILSFIVIQLIFKSMKSRGRHGRVYLAPSCRWRLRQVQEFKASLAYKSL